MTTTEDLIQLSNLLQKLYKDTKLEKFYYDALNLEQYIWTLSDKVKEELKIDLEGNSEGNIENFTK